MDVRKIIAEPADLSQQLPANSVVFINYRRSETAAFADHLYHSFAKRLGRQKVFRDLFSIQLGDNYHLVIEQAINSATVMIVLIGKQWLTIKEKGARQRRLDDPTDYVRLEIEIALQAGINIIPVLVDGAEPIQIQKLPPSIKGLEKFQALHFSWHKDFEALENRVKQYEKARIKKLEEQRKESEQLDISSKLFLRRNTDVRKVMHSGFELVLHAMERSLQFQNFKKKLSIADFVQSYKKLANISELRYWFFPDLIYVIDILGVKSIDAKQSFIARTYPLATLEEIPRHIKAGRPIIFGFDFPENWLVNAAVTKELIAQAGELIGRAVGIVAGWDPWNRTMKVLTPFPNWGNKGVIMLTFDIAAKIVRMHELRYIEATAKPQSMQELQPGSYKLLEQVARPKRKKK